MTRKKVELPWTGEVRPNERIEWSAPPTAMDGDMGPGLYGLCGSVQMVRGGVYTISLDSFGALSVYMKTEKSTI